MRAFFAVLAACAAIVCGSAEAAQLPSEYALNADLAKRLRCMRDAMFTEASIEHDYAQRMVGWVIMQRLKEGRREWRGDVCDIVYGKNQFDGVRRRVVLPDSHPVLRDITRKAAQIILGYWMPDPEHRGAIAFRVVNRSPHSRWFASLKPLKGINGLHTFYQLPAKFKIAGR